MGGWVGMNRGMGREGWIGQTGKRRTRNATTCQLTHTLRLQRIRRLAEVTASEKEEASFGAKDSDWDVYHQLGTDKVGGWVGGWV